jgi:hypothetical protein
MRETFFLIDKFVICIIIKYWLKIEFELAFSMMFKKAKKICRRFKFNSMFLYRKILLKVLLIVCMSHISGLHIDMLASYV